MNQDIKLTDFHRIFIGTAPPEFLIEVFVRTVLVYIAFFLVMRLLGKRFNGQLTVTEMVLVLTMGAIIAVPMQAVDKGLVQGLIVLTLAFFYQRAVSWLGLFSPRFERLTQGSAKMIVKNGTLQMDEIRRNRLSQEMIFSNLRSKSIFNLGSVKRVYVEAQGSLSIYKEESEKPGLSTLPYPDQNIIAGQKKAEGYIACSICGNTCNENPEKECQNCGSKRWTEAVI